MSDKIPEGAEAAAKRYAEAQEYYAHFGRNLKALIDRMNPDHVPPPKLPKDSKTTCREYENMLVYVTLREAEFAKKCETITGVVTGGALNLSEAHDEILGRIACFKTETGG